PPNFHLKIFGLCPLIRWIVFISSSKSLNPRCRSPRHHFQFHSRRSDTVEEIKTMPEARDRLIRSMESTAPFTPRRHPFGDFTFHVDEPDRSLATPIRWGSTATTTTRVPITFSASRGSISPVIRGGVRGGRNLFISQSPAVGIENTPTMVRRGRVRGVRRSFLPSWYPRTPLRDITSVARAFERRRVHLQGIEGPEIATPVPQNRLFVDVSAPGSSAHLEHNKSMMSPKVVKSTKTCSPLVGSVPKILLGVANQNAGESESLTPQKRLLNSIDTVEKEVMAELRKLKRTPTAKRAEREKRVRTLMSMR
ncbi:hypothetical protein RJ641_026450, partial [Dillenia turbinata]